MNQQNERPSAEGAQEPSLPDSDAPSLLRAVEVPRGPSAPGVKAQWRQSAKLATLCALIIGFYALSARPGLLELLGGDAAHSYYNLLVQGFRRGQLSMDEPVPPGLAQLADPLDPIANKPYLLPFGQPLRDLSYYHGKFYLYFGVTPALLLFWPYAALTGHYLSHLHATLIFFSVGFLASTALLWAAWRRYFAQVGFWVLLACALALGLTNFAPAILRRSDVYEVAISCGYALAMLSLGGIWLALHRPGHRGRWLAAASLAYGLAVGARPSLLPGVVMLVVPLLAAWRERSIPNSNRERLLGASKPDGGGKPASGACADTDTGLQSGDPRQASMETVSTVSSIQYSRQPARQLLWAAFGPITLIGLALLLYNFLRFGHPLDFGSSCQLNATHKEIEQFHWRFFWFNFRRAFLSQARLSGAFPFVRDIALPYLPKGANVESGQLPFGILTNVPLTWLALASPLAGRNRPAATASLLRRFIAAPALLFAACVLTLLFHDSLCLRYEVEFASPLIFLAAIGILALERTFVNEPAWRRFARCGWASLLLISVAFNFMAGIERQGRSDYDAATALMAQDKLKEAAGYFFKALRMQPDFAEARNNLGMVLSRLGRSDEAKRQFQMALKLDPEDGWSQYNLGNIARDEGNVDEAMARYSKAVEINPDDVMARLNLGSLLLHLGRADDALIQFRESVQRKPGNAIAHNNLANALGLAGRARDAVVQFNKALALAPDSIPIQNNFAWLLAASPDASVRDGARAAALAQRANQLASGKAPVVLRTLAAAYAEVGRFGDALATAQRALELTTAQSNSDLARNLRAQIELYKAGLPCRDAGTASRLPGKVN